jgi:cytidylate kinase
MYFITMSEMLGTGGETIAKEVAAELQYSFYGETELLKAAEEMGFLSEVRNLDEKSPAFLERFFSEKPKVYLDRLQSVIFEVAKKGNTVFFGRGSQLLLNSFDCALHALVTGSAEKRIERVMKLNRVDREVAEKIVLRSDHDKRGFVRFAFDEDWLNPQLYDVILNTDILSIGSAVKILVDAAKSDEIKACGIDSVKSLGKLSLQRRIDAAFLERGVSNPHLFVTVEDVDRVRLYGLAGTPEEKEMIEGLVKQVQGVKTVVNELTILRASMGGV